MGQLNKNQMCMCLHFLIVNSNFQSVSFEVLQEVGICFIISYWCFVCTVERAKGCTPTFLFSPLDPNSCTKACAKQMWHNVQCSIEICFKWSAQAQYNCSTRKKFLYCSCIALVRTALVSQTVYLVYERHSAVLLYL